MGLVEWIIDDACLVYINIHYFLASCTLNYLG